MDLKKLLYLLTLVFSSSHVFGWSNKRSSSVKCVRSDQWTDDLLHQEFESVLYKIRKANIITKPFPHIEIRGWLSDCMYNALLAELPAIEMYTPLEYAGTLPDYQAITMEGACINDTKCDLPSQVCPYSPDKCQGQPHYTNLHFHDSNATKGLVLLDSDAREKHPLWSKLFHFVHSQNFSRTLYDKLALPDGSAIPLWKQKLVKDSPLMNSAAVRVDPYNYHLSPHIDMNEKVCTWQFFHPAGHQLADKGAGTRFYVPKKEFNFTMNDKLNPRWLDYRYSITCNPHIVFAFNHFVRCIVDAAISTS
jgi:hypothetical protein